MGEGSFRYSLNLCPKILADSPMFSSSNSSLLHLYQYITPLFCLIVSLSLGATRMFFNILPLLKYVCIPYFLQMFLMLSNSPCVYHMTMCSLFFVGWFCVVLFVMLRFVYAWFSLCVLFIAHLGYLLPVGVAVLFTALLVLGKLLLVCV